MPNGGLGKTCFLRYAVLRFPHIQHHLKALRLLVDGQVRPLHVFKEHGAYLLFLVHLHHHAGDFFQPCQLCRRKPPVPDDDGGLARFGIFVPQHRQVLEDAVRPDAVRKLGQIAHVLAGIVGVRL